MIIMRLGKGGCIHSNATSIISLQPASYMKYTGVSRAGRGIVKHLELIVG